MQEDDWIGAYLALRDRIQADPHFAEVVRGYGGHPNAKVPTQRAKRVALEICKRLELDPAIYLGNVFGAAADYIIEHSTPA